MYMSNNEELIGDHFLILAETLTAGLRVSSIKRLHVYKLRCFIISLATGFSEYSLLVWQTTVMTDKMPKAAPGKEVDTTLLVTAKNPRGIPEVVFIVSTLCNSIQITP